MYVHYPGKRLVKITTIKPNDLNIKTMFTCTNKNTANNKKYICHYLSGPEVFRVI